jgi:hypothetical protein
MHPPGPSATAGQPRPPPAHTDANHHHKKSLDFSREERRPSQPWHFSISAASALATGTRHHHADLIVSTKPQQKISRITWIIFTIS